MSAFDNYPARGSLQNNISKLSAASKVSEDARPDESSTEADQGDDLITIGLFLKPGDVVELSQPDREPILAVFVQQFDNISQFFSVNGRWFHSVTARVAFAIPGSIDPALLQPLLPYLPTDPQRANPKGEVHVPADAAAAVRTVLESMTDEAEQIYRTNARILDTAYAVLADDSRTRMMTLHQITKTLLARGKPTWIPSPAALLAVRKALSHNEFRFRSDIRNHRLTNVFAIRSKNDVQVVELVHEWIREYQEYSALSANHASAATSTQSRGAIHVDMFLKKARRLIAHSRQYRDPSHGTLGPIKTGKVPAAPASGIPVTWGEPFSDADKHIINFLQAWVLTGQFSRMPGLHAACTYLLLATDCYGEDTSHRGSIVDLDIHGLSRSTGLVFLQELGVLSPYENRHIYDEYLMLPTVRLSRNLELLHTKAELTRRQPDFRDSMADFRRDWGSTNVYCIDDVGAHEIDDGISIQRAGDHFWIHVHIANPTAFFDKSHTLSGLAAHMTESVYTPERAYPMLPTWATQGYFSLDRNRPVITFSTKIDTAGRVLERKIQHGIIRNVISISPSEVESLLGHQSTLKMERLAVGGDVPSHSTRPLTKLSSEQLEDLRDLFTVAKALWETRKAAGGIRFGSYEPSIRVFEHPTHAGLTWNPPSVDRTRLFHGDPTIEFTNVITQGYIQITLAPKNIVEEMMVLACQTAASWCAERQIPVMYRGTIEPPANANLSMDRIKQLVSSYLKRHEEPPLDLAMRYGQSLGRSIAHSAPLPHKIIGVPSYAKVTSPLRRFSDMITHWQIEAAIRYEAQTGKQFNATESAVAREGILPFSHRQMQDSIVTLAPRERIISMTKRSSTQFWTCLALLRAFHYGEAPLPGSFKFWVRAGADGIIGKGKWSLGNLTEYGLKARMVDQENMEPAKTGDLWEVGLDSVDVFGGNIFVRPVRLLSRGTDLF